MSISTTNVPLSPAEVAQIPSTRLPISSQLSHLLSEFTSLSIQLFTILSSPSNPSVPLSSLTTPIYTSLSEIDSKLSKLVQLVALHQQRQQRINSLVDQLESLSSSSYTSTETLSSCISRLEPIISSGKLDRSSIQLASPSPSEHGPLSSTALLSYARLLAPFTSAPPSSLYPPSEKLRTKSLGSTDPTGRTLPPGAIPPFPTEGVMRRGRLQFGREFGGGDGLGQTGEIGAHRDGQELHPNQNGIDVGGGGKDSTMERLQYEAKQYENGVGVGAAGSSNFASTVNNNGNDEEGEEEEEEEEQFEFDLDLNPDL
ncbi:hypothetical protein JCM5350_008241 [Sporobolomyces pararoseus]